MLFVAKARAARSDSPIARKNWRWASQPEPYLQSHVASVPSAVLRLSRDVGPTVQLAPRRLKAANDALLASRDGDWIWPAAAQNGASMRAVRPPVRKAA